MFATLAGLVATNLTKKNVLGTVRDNGKLTPYGFEKVGDDFVMFWVMMKMMIKCKNKHVLISNLWLAETLIRLIAKFFAQTVRHVLHMQEGTRPHLKTHFLWKNMCQHLPQKFNPDATPRLMLGYLNLTLRLRPHRQQTTGAGDV